MAAEPLSGSKLVLAGLVLLAVPSVLGKLQFSDLAMAVLLFVPTLLGAVAIAIGGYRIVKSRPK